MINTVLAIGAHPDDIEFCMAGTLLHLHNIGWKVVVMHVADGSCGSNNFDGPTIAELRRAESIKAAQLVHAEYINSLTQDMAILYTSDLLTRLAAIVRQVKPTVILTHPLNDYIEDHTTTAKLAVSAAFSRTMNHFNTNPPIDPFFSDVTVYHCQSRNNRNEIGHQMYPSFYINIEHVLDAKTQMLACHVSQKSLFEEKKLRMRDYLQTMHSHNLELGNWSGCFKYAEGFSRHNPAGLCSDDNHILEKQLGDYCTWH